MLSPDFKSKETIEILTKVFKNFRKQFFVFFRLDDQFDLVSFVWKPPALNEKSTGQHHHHLDVDLKLKCLSPHLAGICSELEEKLQEVLRDFVVLGDPVVKLYLSSLISEELVKFCGRQKVVRNSLFLGRFCSALEELCPPLWKLVDKQVHGAQLKESLSAVCESSWNEWGDNVMDSFVVDLESKMSDLSPSTIASFMPVRVLRAKNKLN
jgi:hypothetical protein